MSRKIGTFCIGLGAALVLAALSLFLWNQREARAADASAADALAAVTARIATGETAAPDPLAGMAEAEIDGYAYIGYLTLPTEELELPVMSSWSYEQLRIAPCRYAGSTGTDDLVLAGHNYTRHFGPIENLAPGDPVLFTGMDGVTIAYEVAEVDTLAATAVEEMTDSGFDLTLFTCNYSGQARVTVRCNRAR
ncbi:MAG: sortase [Gemmiger sp.]